MEATAAPRKAHGVAADAHDHQGSAWRQILALRS